MFAANDIAAVRVSHRAADLGVAVPERLSVVGYDSSAVALTVRPHLTSVNQPRQEMGRIAARMLAGAARGPTHGLPQHRRARAAHPRLHRPRTRLPMSVEHWRVACRYASIGTSVHHAPVPDHRRDAVANEPNVTCARSVRAGLGCRVL
ncbi:substrate-binding domain-containing protein [Brachybacterium sp. GPGPB12]|uniref:substrate-binding domain-containing protein n=1 Tax=Brachybacterium sp. GPGPB12 TaxID=3023517 RepID=UPI0031343208